MRPLLALALAALVLPACASASIEEAYGRPDPFDWSYFEGSPRDVVSAIQETFYQSGVQVQSVQNEGRGVLITVASQFDGARSSQIYVEATTEEGFEARAQIYPVRDPLPRWLEMEVSGRI